MKQWNVLGIKKRGMDMVRLAMELERGEYG
jgi:hypothetical protein